MTRRYLAITALLLAACAHQREPLDAAHTLDENDAPELSATPFYPQRDYQCGPAALATVLVASGVEVTPDQLVSQVYLPARKGSLQAELIAAARSYQRLALPIDGQTGTIMRELRAGNPVLVLLNLGVSWLPVWHYAVVIGYDAADASFILRSGTRARVRMSAVAFDQAWAGGQRWAIVISTLTQIPPSSTPAQWLTATAPLESLGQLDGAEQAYRTAVARWPDSPLAWTAIANVHARRGQWPDAVRDYSISLQLHDDAVVRNNRAAALGELSCTRAARDDIAQAVRLDHEQRYREVLMRTHSALADDDHCPAAIVTILTSPQ